MINNGNVKRNRIAFFVLLLQFKLFCELKKTLKCRNSLPRTKAAKNDNHVKQNGISFYIYEK